MNILVISSMLPYPPDNGGGARLFNIYNRLARHHTITWICPVWEGEEGNVGGAEQFCRSVVQLPHSEQRPLPDRGWSGLLLRIVARMHWERLFVYCFGYVKAPGIYWLPATPDRLELLSSTFAAGQFDLIVSEFEGNAELVLPECGVPSILSTHNVLSSMFRRIRGTYSGSKEDRIFAWAELQKIIRYERRNYAGYNAAVAVSQEDRDALLDRCPRLPVTVIPNGVDIDFFSPGTDAPDAQSLVYVGNYNYPPNADAVIFFCKEILPLIRQNAGNIRLTLVGADPPAELAGIEGVDLAGRVPDIRPYVQSAGIMVAPLRVGGGTRLKILDGLAMGKAIVSTTIGAEGLAVTHGKDILLADHPSSFAQSVVELIQHPDQRSRLGQHGRALVEGEYNWNVLAERFRMLCERTAVASTASRSGNPQNRGKGQSHGES